MTRSLDTPVCHTIDIDRCRRMARGLRAGVDEVEVSAGVAAATLAFALAWWASDNPSIETATLRIGANDVEVAAKSLMPDVDGVTIDIGDLAHAIADHVGDSDCRDIQVTISGTPVCVRIDDDAQRVRIEVPAHVLADDLAVVVADVVIHPRRPIASVRAETAEYRLEQQNTWNDTDAPRDRPDLIELIAEQWMLRPDELAVVDDDQRLTYRQLQQRATALACELAKLNVGAESVVGIAMPRSADMVVAIVATLMTGGAFVPVDPSWPSARRRHVIDTASVMALIVHSEYPLSEDDDELVDQAPQPITVYCDGNDVSDERHITVPSAYASEGLAYVIFTSGSTGTPKGAMIRRGAIVERLLWQRDEILHFTHSDAALFKAPLAFDISINEILLPLVSGGRVVVAAPGGERDPHYLLSLISREHVTFAYLVSSMLDVLLALDDDGAISDSDDAQGSALATLRHVWCGGELLTQALFSRFRTQLRIPMYHGYGPAEATIGVSHVIYSGDEARMGPSIGSANPNTSLYVLDNELRPTVIGEAGELYAAGYLLGRGYAGQPGLTAGRYVADPFAGAGGRMYRTGDLVRRCSDGSLEFIGRADNQVKIRGMRLELEDVESALAQHDDVRMPCVLLLDGRLVGYVVPHAGSTVSGEEIRDWSRSVLPDFMVPSLVMILDEFPTTVNGKLDRRALPEPDFAGAPTHSDSTMSLALHDMPDELAAVVEAMAVAVGREQSEIDINADFFDMGGDSLRAITILGSLRRRGWRATVSNIFDGRTAQGIAERITRVSAVGHDTDDDPYGVIDSSPIVRWMAQTSPHVDGFVQAVEFYAPSDLTVVDAAAVLSAVVATHPALRAHIVAEPTLHLRIDDADVALPAVTELGDYELTDCIDLLTQHLDPANGHVICAGLRDRAAHDGISTPGRSIVIVIHHLVCDGVSWEILREDLNAAMSARRAGTLSDSGVSVPADRHPVLAEGTSWRRWTQLLNNSDFECDTAYFAGVLATSDVALSEPGRGTVDVHADRAHAPTVADEMSRVHEATTAITATLLEDVATGFGVSVETILVTALALSLAQWRTVPQSHTIVELEGHGRETRHVHSSRGEADLSRTIGWFTTLYPSVVDPGVVDTADDGQVARALKVIKDQLALVPHRGLGYGVQRYLSGATDSSSATGISDAALEGQPQVLLNYLGHVGGSAASGADDYFVIADTTGQLGERRDDRQRLPRVLEFNAITEGDGEHAVLRTTISWARTQLSADRIDALVDVWDAALAALSRVARYASHSAGDFALTADGTTILNHDELDVIDTPTLLDIIPLTPLQQGMYFHSVFDGETSCAYVEQQIVHVTGRLDTDRLRRAAVALMYRHPILTAAFATNRAGAVYMSIDSSVADALAFTVIERNVGDDIDIAALAESDRRAGFNLAQPPLMRYIVISDGNQHTVVQTVHHLIADGWSVPIMSTDLFACYRDDVPVTARYHTDRGFAGYVRLLAARDNSADVARWRTELSEPITPIVLAPGATAAQTMIEHRITGLPEDLEESIRDSGLRLIDTIEAAWGVVLRSCSGVTGDVDIVFGSTVSGRDSDIDGIDNAVGMFINTVPVRACGASASADARELVTSITVHHDRVRDCQHVGLTDIARACGRNAGELFDTLVVVEIDTGGSDVDTAGTGLQITGIDNDGAPHYPLTLVIAPGAPQLLRIICDSAVVPEARAQRIGRQLCAALEVLVSGGTVGEVTRAIDRVGESAPDTLRRIWDRSVQSFSSQPALGDLESVHIASYRDVDISARALAQRITYAVADNISRPRVAILLDRSPDYVEAIIAATIAGATYIPLDPYSPAQRLTLIFDDARPDVVVTSATHRRRVQDLVGATIAIVESDAADSDSDDGDAATVAVSAHGGAVVDTHTDRWCGGRSLEPDDIAYILYTSGSTGAPKGVAVTHRNVVALLHNADSYVDVGVGDIWSICHSLAFDFSVWEMWAPLRTGGTAMVAGHGITRSPSDLGRALHQHAVTVVNQTPTSFQSLDAAQVTLPALRYLIFGGERLEPRALREWNRRHPGVQSINMYGITETTVHVTALNMNEAMIADAGSPIGRPLHGLRVSVLDDHLRPVGRGEVGVVCVSGPQLSLGYWRRHGLTATRFVADPWGVPGSRMYYSGDRARVRTDGGLDYIGRADTQLQLRGFRIEAGEVEAALRAHSEVHDAVVLAVGDELRAILVSRTDVGSNDGQQERVSRVRRGARDALPAYMIPTQWSVTTSIPVTVNGKRDDDALRALNVVGEESASNPASAVLVDDAPTTASVAITAAIADALDTSDIRADDDFFARGGDSIIAIRVANRCASAGVSITPRDIFLGRTPEGIAARIASVRLKPQSTIAAVGSAVATPILLREQLNGFDRGCVQARAIDLTHASGGQLPVTTTQLTRALRSVVAAHPMLTAEITGTGAGQALSIRTAEPAVNNYTVEAYESVDDAMLTLSERIDPATGVMIGAGLVVDHDAADDNNCPITLVLVAHHACVDSVSWMIIADDLQAALGGSDIADEPTPFAHYSVSTLLNAMSPETAQTLPVWEQLHASTALCERSVWDRHELSSYTMSIAIPEVATVIFDAARAWGVDTTDVMTGLVVDAIGRLCTLPDSLLIDVEGHGRPQDDILDCGRTVGWFTQIAPIRVITAGSAGQIVSDVHRARSQQLSPATYMALRYMHPVGRQVLAAGGAQVLVNYLGRGESRDVLPVSYQSAYSQYAVEADIWVTGDQPALVIALQIAGELVSVSHDAITAALHASVIELANDAGAQSQRAIPTTALQRGLVFQSQIAAAGSYIAQTALTFDRHLDPEVIAQAFADTVVIHPAMGACFSFDGGAVTQIVPTSTSRIVLPVTVVEIDDDCDGAIQEKDIRDADRVTPIAIDIAPAARATVVRRTGCGDVLIFTYHLAVIDGWSRAPFLQEFLHRIHLRENPDASIHSQPVPAQPSIVDVAQTVANDNDAAAIDFWTQYLHGLSAPTLVATRSDDVDADAPGLPGRIYRSLDGEQTRALRAAAAEYGVTATTMTTLAVALALHTVTADSDVVFGLSVSGRDRDDIPGIERVVGVLLNTVVTRVRLSPQMTVAEVLRNILTDRASAMPHDAADLGRVQQAIGMPTLFDSMVVFQNFLDLAAAQRVRDDYGILAEEAEDSTHFPLTWVFTPADKLALKVEYRTERIDVDLAQHLADTAIAALEAMSEARAVVPSPPLASLSVLPIPSAALPSAAEAVRAQSVTGVGTVLDAFASAASEHRDDVAVVCGSQQQSFAELMHTVTTLAGYLSQRRIGVGSTVVIAVPRSIDVVAAIFGTLWSGARYVPLDLEHPDDRLMTIIADCAPDAVIAAAASVQRMRAITSCDVIDIADTRSAQPVSVSRARENDDAYVIYTSGSTGKPKGVVTAHAGLANMLENHRRKIFAPAVTREGRTFRVAHAISFAFDMSWEELLWLAHGHQVHICDEELRRDAALLTNYIQDFEIDVINVTPGYADQLLAHGLLDGSRHIPPLILLGGEAVSEHLWNALRDCDKTRGYNLYGPTEYTINTLGVGTDESVTPAIGQPVDNTVAMILDSWLRPVADGVAGELYVTGVGMARSYHRRAARTALSMVAAPVGACGSRMYRTGDLVRRRADGHIDYLGRTDDQIKIRGHRVDPGDVDNAVREAFTDSVSAVATVVHNGELVCHLITAERDPELLLRDVRSYLQSVLPEYLVPLRYSARATMPLTVNGKIDVQALGHGNLITEEANALGSDDEYLVADLMAEALDSEDDITTDVDFFAVGGHSMSAVRLAALLRSEFDTAVPVKKIYELRTVSALTVALRSG